MAPSNISALKLIAHAVGALFVGFGINAIINPVSALSFFEFTHPAGPADVQLVNDLLAVYGVRDIFMGLAIFSAGLFGTNKSLGWTLIAGSGVAAADGFVCYVRGQGQWSHWGYAPVLAVVGTVLTGLFD